MPPAARQPSAPGPCPPSRRPGLFGPAGAAKVTPYRRALWAPLDLHHTDRRAGTSMRVVGGLATRHTLPQRRESRTCPGDGSAALSERRASGDRALSGAKQDDHDFLVK